MKSLLLQHKQRTFTTLLFLYIKIKLETILIIIYNS